MKLLLVGGGGREHALAWRLRHENPDLKILAAPGNPGIAAMATCVDRAATDVDALVELARQEAVDWTLVGPEAPLGLGIVDAFHAARLPIFGPTRAAAMLETSKAYSKTLMIAAGVPTARAMVCRDVSAAHRAVEELGVPVVIKASGLAAGKGVIICQTISEANAAIAAMLQQNAFGDAGTTILVEELMEGEELSVFVLTDGERVIPLPAAQDHKRLLEGDRGPNTGGMGAYCPVSIADASTGLIDTVVDRVIRPTLGAMRARGTPFTGLLYAGLMLTNDGPKVVEFNCRFGDPETQAVLPVMSPNESIGEVMFAIARGDAIRENVEFRATRSAVTTVLAAGGYPDHPRSGDTIKIPPTPANVLVFHSGTRRQPNEQLVTAGGRVLAITGLGRTLDEAQRRSRDFARSVTFDNKQFRADIGWREVARRAGATGD
ncbi:MAG TPA: phosphoribosylamine--glycine ligase [Gemmatimonadaceae bacterium]|nr:phosphoribosylamine--glycine ligase [Gemmatimonadaceae bacterium]